MTYRVAAIDCGTNSIRLLIADIKSTAHHPERERGPRGLAPAPLLALSDVRREMRIVRLGEGVDRTGRLSEAALDRTISALREYAGLIAETKLPSRMGGSSPASGAVFRHRGLPPPITPGAPNHPRRPPSPLEAVRMVATSATRDAENSREFTARVVDVLGVAPEVISGDEEARLSFAGATRELAGTALGAEGQCPPPYLVTDIGGGSTEFVLGDPGAAGKRLAARSVNIGCVRMTERHLHGDPPSASEIAAATDDIDAALDQAAASVPVASGAAGAAGTLVGLAGSVTTVAAIALGLDAYDSERIHHSRVSAARVHEIAAGLLAMTRAERAAIPVMHPGRVDVIGAGALILDRVMTRFGFAEVLVSEHDILDGIAWSLVP